MTGRLLVNQAMLIRHWKGLQNEDQYQAIIDPIIRDMTKQQFEWEFLRTDNSNASKLPRNDFEWKVMDLFTKGPKPEEEPGKEYQEQLKDDFYIYYQPIRAVDSCLLACHRAPGNINATDPGSSPVALGGRRRRTPRRASGRRENNDSERRNPKSDQSKPRLFARGRLHHRLSGDDRRLRHRSLRHR